MIVTDDGFVYIARKHTIKWKVEIEIDGSYIDVTDKVIGLRHTKVATTETHSAVIKLINVDSEYSNKFYTGEYVKIYYDFENGDTLKFYGRIKQVQEKMSDMSIELKCEHISAQFLDIMVTESYENTETSEILKDLIDNYASDYTYSNVNTTETNVTISWNNKPLFDCITDLCDASGYDFYVDENKDVHFFEKNSILNTDDVVVPDNVINVSGLGKDSSPVRNRVRVIGRDEHGIPILYTVEDDSTHPYIKETVINDSSIKTYEQAKDIGDSKLEELKAVKKSGIIQSYLLLYLNPGEKIWISLPMHKIHDKFRVIKIEHDILNITTKCTIEYKKNVSHTIKDRFVKEMQLEESPNPYKLEYSYNIHFEDYSQIESHTNTHIDNNEITVASDKDNASFITNSRTHIQNITKCQLKIQGTDLSDSVFRISVDDGTSWELVLPDQLHNIIGTGNILKLKVNMNKTDACPNPRIKSIGVLYV